MNRTRTGKNVKRLIVWLLMLTMVFSLLPMAAFADEAVEEPVQEPAESAPVEPEEPAEPSVEPKEPTDVIVIDGDELPEDELDTLAADDTFNYIDKSKNVPLKDAGDMGYRIVHIDCGRKCFSLTDLKKIVDYAYEYGYTHVELAFGNDALRFLLDDMSLTVGGNSYDSNTVKSAIQSGNAAFYASGELSQGEMDAIISYANDKGIGIIPMFDAPGHMQAVVSAMKTLGLTPKYSTPTNSGESLNYAIDTTDALSVNFVQALVQKYITYFAGKGCTMFNIAADECGFSGMTTEQYTAYAKFVNSMAAMVQNAGMTALAFNDGIYHIGLTTDTAFDTNIAICYWDASDKKYAPASTLAGDGFKIINTHNKWYYVVGNEGNEWYGYSWAQGYLNGECKDCRQTDGGYTTNVGCMIAIWCDNPGDNANWSNVENHIKTLSKNNSSYFKKAEQPATPTLTAEKNSVKVGETVALSLENYTGDVEWSSSAPEVLSVEANGTSATATAVAVGSATITAAAGGSNYTVDITVKAAEEIDYEHEESITIGVGATSKVYTQNGSYGDINNAELKNEDGTVVARYSAVNKSGTDYVFSQVNTVSANSKYYIKSADGKYLTSTGSFTDDFSQAAEWTCKKLYNYYLQTGSNYLKWDDNSNSWTVTDSYRNRTQLYFNNETFYRSYSSWGSTYSNPLGVPGTKREVAAGDITQITFTGVEVGTTYVVIGNTKYTIEVIPEDLSKAAALPIQLWITNNTIEASGENAKNSGYGWGGDSSFGYARYINIPAATRDTASKVNSEQGMSVTDAFTAAGMTEPLVRYEWGGTRLITAEDDKPAQNLVFWIGRIHNSIDSNIQNVWGADYSNSGAAFNYVRYWGGAWQVSADRETWTTVTGEGSTGTYNSCEQQLAAYFMTRTKITEEIITDVADWGKPKGGTEYTSQVNSDFVLLDYAVKYEDGIRVPIDFPVKDKTLAYHCETNNAAVGTDSSKNKYRMLNNFRGVETEDFEVYMVTVTMTADSANTTHTASEAENDYTYDGTEQIVWDIDQESHDKSGLADYTSISGSSTYSGCTIGGDPYVRGVEIYNKHGALITYYVRAKKTVENLLTVNYYVEGESTPFYSYNIAVDETTTFNTGFARTENPLGLINNTVKNIKDVEQAVNWKLEEMPQINAQYRYVDYKFTKTDFTGDDYKIVNLYYTFTATKTFVVDFGLPLVITPGDINKNLTEAGVTLTDVEFGKLSSYASITKDNNCNVTYTLTSMISSSDNFSLQYSGTLKVGENLQSGRTAEYTVTIIPASNVYYEDGFAKFTNGAGAASTATWDVVKDKDDENAQQVQAVQELSELGSGKIYGYDSAYDNSTKFSMGSAHKVTVTSSMLTGWKNDSLSAWPTAKFSFKGTGFDVISLTNNTSGAILVDVYNSNEKIVKSYFVDNYLGYGFVDGEWTVKATGDNILYQIPVMKVCDLPYGSYNVTITVFYNDAFAHNDDKDDKSYDFWLDAIRVYDPMGKDDTRYVKDGEGYPQYINLRDQIAASESNVGIETTLFIDGNAAAEVAAYINLGPNNEVYLAKGQAISFKLPVNGKIDKVQIGAKAPAGESGMTVNDATPTGIASATEMYYDITSQAKNGQVTITNTTGNILSLTNIKITFSEKLDEPVSLAPLSEGDAEAAVATVRALFAAPVDPEPTEPEQPEEPEKTFKPERFEPSWSSNVRKGGHAVLTVKASTDVDAIIVDGVTYTKYFTRTERVGRGWNAQRVTYREFVYMMTVNESGTLTVPVVAVSNEQGESNPYETTLTVKPSSPIRDWIGGLFGRWF